EGDTDPLAELQSIPTQIQAEVDMVLQPITDVDVVIDQIAAMPGELGIDAASLTAMAKASLEGAASASVQDGEVSIEIDASATADVAAEAKAEVEAKIKEVLLKVRGIVVGLKETPERAKTATTNIVALGTKSAALVTKLTAQYQAKLGNPLLKADAKAEIQANLDAVIKLDADIKATITDAKATVTELPSKGKEALVKITAAFAGGASASAG
ncbi:MAG: hypothetical protein KDK70_32920, partial [Myxococcales bacterium]|nr:hypothetical protein [Myxococcales bacterium]